MNDPLGTRSLRTFRDPAGFLEVKGEAAVRHVRAEAAADVLTLLRTQFYRTAVETGACSSSRVLDPTSGTDLVLEHPLVFFPSYSWEWSPAQWVAAGDLTLRLCEAALPEGWLLKDATPLNILFEGSRPVLVDVLSPERRNPRSPIWTAKAQFIRTFLLPLLAYRWLGWPLAGSLLRRDGITPEELAPVLPRLRLLRPSLFWNVSLPAWLERRRSIAPDRLEAARTREADPEIATALLRRTLRSMRRALREAASGETNSQWKQYAGALAHYPAQDQETKQQWVAACLSTARPAAVLDIGANTGTYSRMAAQAGARVVAIDTDIASIDALYRRTAETGEDIQPLVVNIGRPTPAAGWQNAEQRSFLDRAAGRFDLVLMLAVVHHLLLTEQIPLVHIAGLAAELTTRWLVLEWVPVADPMFQQLMRGRTELYGHLSEQHLLDAFTPGFRVERRQALTNGRILFLLEKRA